MGDDESRPTLEEDIQAEADLLLGIHVDIARRLVEDDELGVGRERPGKGEKLLFPRGDIPAALPEIGLDS